MEPLTIGLLASAGIAAAKSLFGGGGSAAAPVAAAPTTSFADLQAMQKTNPLATAGGQVGQQTQQQFQPLSRPTTVAPAVQTEPTDPVERLRLMQQGQGY